MLLARSGPAEVGIGELACSWCGRGASEQASVAAGLLLTTGTRGGRVELRFLGANYEKPWQASEGPFLGVAASPLDAVSQLVRELYIAWGEDH